MRSAFFAFNPLPLLAASAAQQPTTPLDVALRQGKPNSRG
jgi:hypothetical protein